MTKKEILEKIKSYNKSILFLRLEEKRNQLTTNFDEANARAEAISNARDAENETIRKELLKYFKDYDSYAAFFKDLVDLSGYSDE